MLDVRNILETNRMITENKLDVRTITMGISLRDCGHPNITQFCQNVYDKITRSAEFLVKTGEDIEAEYGVPIINKRISVTPIAIAAEACHTDSYVPVAEALDKFLQSPSVLHIFRIPCGISLVEIYFESVGYNVFFLCIYSKTGKNCNK